MQIYHVETQEDYDALMVELEGRGTLWIDGAIPTEGNCWKFREEKTAILLNDENMISHGSLIATKRDNHLIPIEKYKAKQYVNQKEKINKELNKAVRNLGKALREADVKNDIVNSPNHYKQGERETIENIRDTISSEGYQGYCVGDVVKYLARYKFKNGLEDVRKAKKYIEFLEEELMKQEG